ncbi:vacuolar protein sorting-associated protein 13B [Caerostris extrusa]|uniref:Vacuolar protein sorting-associated protein 13B n=1 Tax=Caerostris extrusa TaxID=172846 RepID=A0AAV4TMS9_CAEEX|nr:vacuolar protein sorting-associated protein 13B [Caerostris extrusa]
MHAYSWCCHKSKQLLRLSVGSLSWNWSRKFSIDTEGITTIKLNNNVVAVIKIKRLSNFQKQVIIDGQLIIHNQLSYPIQLRCEFPVYSPADSKSPKSFFIKSLAPQCSSPAFILTAEQCKCMQISATAILDSQLWSKNISIGDNVPLEIPWKTNNRFQSVWCQVIQQKTSTLINSIVVFLAPLFVLRSNLPMPINVEITSQGEGKTCIIELIGQGHEINVFKSSGVQSELQLSFLSKTDLKITSPLNSISLSDMSKILLHKIDDSENLYDYCHTMKPVHYKLWPYSFLERPSNLQTCLEALYPCSDRQNDILPAVPSSNVSCKLKIECSQRWTGLNTVLYDIKPDVILINRLRTDLFLFNKNEMEWMLPPNSVAIPFQPYESFRLSILENGEFFYSSPLVVEKNCSAKIVSSKENLDSAFFYDKTIEKIPQNGSVNVLIRIQMDKQKVILFKLHSELQENIVVITAFPVIILACETDKELLFSLSCATNDTKNITLPATDTVIFENTSKDTHPLLVWEAISDISSLDSSVILDYFVTITTPSSQSWSIPTRFHSEMNENSRHSISVPIKCGDNCFTTIPLAITSHQHNGMLFLIANIDTCPLLLLHNRTNVNIYYGQSSSSTIGKNDNRAIYEEHQKHSAVPVISPGSSAHYSFPSLQKQFPCVPDDSCLLCFGLKEDNGPNFVWSIPFKVDVAKQFVHILGVCDFMVCSERIGHTVNLFIDPVNRIEVTANEVRSRIVLATNASINCDKKESVKSKDSVNEKVKEYKQKTKAQLTSIKRTRKPSASTVKPSKIYFVSLRIIHVSLIICDEFQEINESIEILRLNIDNVILYSRPQNENFNWLQDISLCFEHIQLDNQMNEGNIVYDFPVVLHRHIEAKNTQSDDSENIFLPNKIRENSMFICKIVIELPCEDNNCIVVQSVDVEMLPVSLYLEDSFYYKIMDLLKTYVPISFHEHELQWCDIYIPKDIKCISTIFMYPVHFQHFKFNIQEVSLSLHASLKLYLSLEHSLLRFQPFERENIFTSHYEIGRMIIIHYFTGALFRAGWVVGSLDLLGNPAGFARAVGVGMSDFVYLPYRGLMHGPRAFISGLTNGAISLFTQISSGAITCVASLASSISKNMDFLCLDGEHLARQEITRRHLPQGISEGLTQGLNAFGLSILGAVAGLVDHPLQVLVSPSTPLETATGIVGGLGKGIIGVFTKPIGGAAELLSQTGHGFLHGAGWLNPPKRQYQPVTMSFKMVSSSAVKYICKVALCQSFGDVLLHVEATYVNENGEYEKNILLLTSEALFIIPNCAFRKKLFLESGNVVERVTEYLKKNHEEVSNSAESDLDFSNHQDMIKPEILNSSSSYHIFFLYPKDRNLFLTLFNYAKSKALHKGF